MKSYNIKQKVKVFVLIIGTAVLAGCTNLDETIYSSYTDENFPSSPKQYASMTGPIYVAAQKLFDNNLYELQEMGTDLQRGPHEQVKGKCSLQRRPGYYSIQCTGAEVSTRV